MDQEIFNNETTATSVTLTGMDNHEFLVAVGGSFGGATVEVAIKPKNGIQFYKTDTFTAEDCKTITVPKSSELKFTTTGVSGGINAEIVPLV